MSDLIAAQIMDSLSQDDRFSYHLGYGFRVTVPNGMSFQSYPRASISQLKDLLVPNIKLTRGGHLCAQQPGPPPNQPFVWWLAQLLHYGLPFAFGKDNACAALKQALLTGTLRVPDVLRDMERSLRVNTKRRAKRQVQAPRTSDLGSAVKSKSNMSLDIEDSDDEHASSYVSGAESDSDEEEEEDSGSEEEEQADSGGEEEEAAESVDNDETARENGEESEGEAESDAESDTITAFQSAEKSANAAPSGTTNSESNEAASEIDGESENDTESEAKAEIRTVIQAAQVSANITHLVMADDEMEDSRADINHTAVESFRVQPRTKPLAKFPAKPPAKPPTNLPAKSLPKIFTKPTIKAKALPPKGSVKADGKQKSANSQQELHLDSGSTTPRTPTSSRRRRRKNRKELNSSPIKFDISTLQPKPGPKPQLLRVPNDLFLDSSQELSQKVPPKKKGLTEINSAKSPPQQKAVSNNRINAPETFQKPPPKQRDLNESGNAKLSSQQGAVQKNKPSAPQSPFITKHQDPHNGVSWQTQFKTRSLIDQTEQRGKKRNHTNRTPDLPSTSMGAQDSAKSAKKRKISSSKEATEAPKLGNASSRRENRQHCFELLVPSQHRSCGDSVPASLRQAVNKANLASAKIDEMSQRKQKDPPAASYDRTDRDSQRLPANYVTAATSTEPYPSSREKRIKREPVEETFSIHSDESEDSLLPRLKLTETAVSASERCSKHGQSQPQKKHIVGLPRQSGGGLLQNKWLSNISPN